VCDQPATGRFQRDGGQSAAKVRFVEGHGPQSGSRGIGMQPAQSQLIPRREKNESVGGPMPIVHQVGMSYRELECRMRRLAGLCRGREVFASDQVEAGGEALTVWHGDECT
jgi:hypothetical protein